MTVDLLSVRLKEAKRELTALKTAHKRGLGGLKVFQDYLEFDIAGSSIASGRWMLDMTIEFDDKFPEYPFLTAMGQCSNSYVSNVDIVSMDFTDGHTLKAQFNWENKSGLDPYRIYFYSNSPIISYEYRFISQV